MSHDHTGVVIEDGAEDGLGRAVGGADLGAMHEIRDPEIIDVLYFVGLAHIGPILEGEPSLLFDDPEQGICSEPEADPTDPDPEAFHRVFAPTRRDGPCI